jgi:hypothetical protein
MSGRAQAAAAAARPRRQGERVAFAALMLGGLAACLVMLWAWSWNVNFNDYATEARLPLTALLHGHLARFFGSVPAYGGSLELRAPFALIASLGGGGAEAIYRFAALPCVFAFGALGLWAARGMRRARVGWAAVVIAVAVCVANPLTYYALAIGHPEELLGGVLCAGAVLAAMRGNAVWAGLLLGAAIANKEWAVLAIGPVLIALPQRRLRALALAGAVALALLAPIAIAAGSVSATGGRLTVSESGAIFNAQQIWWFLGTPGHWVAAMGTQLPRGYRLPPGWLGDVAHPLIIWIAVPLTLLAIQRRIGRERALLLLALLFLLRCMLDPWDVVYYPIPLVVALFAWETVVAKRAPLGAGAVSVAAALIFKLVPNHLGLNGQALIFIAASCVALAMIARATYRNPGTARAEAGADSAHSTTINSFGKWLRRSTPSSVTTARSSIRTPS